MNSAAALQGMEHVDELEDKVDKGKVKRRA